MNQNEINPKLKKELEHLQDVPQRGFQASHAGRETYLLQAKGLKQRQIAAGKTARKTHRSWVPRLAAIFAVLLVALSSIGGTAYAAQASQPDDLLYPVKILTEDIQIGLENDPEDRLDLYTSFASRRLAEIEAQLTAGEEVSEKALALLEKHTQKMLEEATQIGEQGLNNALRQIEENLQKQNQMMEKIKIQTPGGGAPGLLKAQEKIRERLELVDNGLNEPQGFRETMKERKENAENPAQGNQDGNDNSNKPDTPPGQENKDNSNNGQGKGN